MEMNDFRLMQFEKQILNFLKAVLFYYPSNYESQSQQNAHKQRNTRNVIAKTYVKRHFII